MPTKLETIRDLVQMDVGNRGLQTDPVRNLISDCPNDFSQACTSLAQNSKSLHLAIVTGFFIPTGKPPSGETDGPLGALFLARALVPLGIKVTLVTDLFCASALRAGIQAGRLSEQVKLIVLPSYLESASWTSGQYWSHFEAQLKCSLSHLMAIERAGPNHSLESLQRQMGNEAGGEIYLDFLTQITCEESQSQRQNRCFTMRGIDITQTMSPAHWLFEEAEKKGIITIGIGDGGNEIGMGKIPWEIIARNIPNGGLVACRIPARFLIVAGISNWGAYGLAAGIWHLKGHRLHSNLADPQQELTLLQIMVKEGPLVDGVIGKPQATVDGLDFRRYIEVLKLV